MAKNYVIAKTDDGTLQITYTIPYTLVEKNQEEVLLEEGKSITVPGFRKGKAPVDRVADRVSKETLVQKALTKILPKLLAETIKEEDLKIAIYPKFELISADDNKPWQVRATTCEIPKIKLGDYKKELVEKAKQSTKKAKKELTSQEKEQQIISAIISSSKTKMPKILLEEEVNARLSKLLARLEKLGLSLEQYLASMSKNAESLREEYRDQSRQALVLDLTLLTIAEKEKIKVEESEIDDAIKASSTDPDMAKHLNNPQERSQIRTVLVKKKAIDSLISYL